MLQKYYAEVIGTFILVFIGCGAAAVNDVTDGTVTHVGVALVFGLVVMAIIYAIGDVSGAHINPAVTLAFWASGRFKTGDVMPYLLCQVTGALLGAGLLQYLFPGSERLGSTVPVGSWQQSFVLELVLTFILMFAVLCVSTGSKEKGIMAGAALGAVIAFEALMGGPISGASMNPARSLGPALVSMTTQDQWIYLVAPPLGALLAVPAFRCTQPKTEDDEESGA